MSFFKSFFAALLALVVFSLLSFFLLIGWVASLSAETEVKVSDNSVLYLPFNKPVAERELEDPFGDAFPGATAGYTGVIDLVESINKAAEDDRISGILIETSDILAGPAQLEEIRQALKSFKSTDKFIYAFGENLSENTYYLASVADSVFVSSNGNFEFNGMVMEIPYFKKTLDKLNIEAQIFKVGDFKDAIEPFIRTDMSEDSRMQNQAFLNDIQTYYLQNISIDRNIPIEELKRMSEQLEIRNVDDAVENRLIDGARYRDEVISSIKDELGIEQDEDVDLIPHESYRKVEVGGSRSKNRIAVIVAEGTIIDGEGTNESVGSATFVDEIRYARESDRIKAVVLRVNSPGGSFIASDVMWRELKLTAQKKPLIASMSNYAASGGYYIAMIADTIVAYPNTITGSIGIFSVVPDFSGFMDNKLGITFDRVKTGEYSDIVTVTRPLTDFEKQVWQKQTEEGYETFTSKAAQGRGMQVDDLKSIASGRVWTGNQAIENGLVDVLGTFDDAVQLAAEKADIGDDYELRFYPKRKTVLEEFLEDLGGGVEARILRNKYGEIYPYLEDLKQLREWEGVQARLPFSPEVRF